MCVPKIVSAINAQGARQIQIESKRGGASRNIIKRIYVFLWTVTTLMSSFRPQALPHAGQERWAEIVSERKPYTEESNGH